MTTSGSVTIRSRRGKQRHIIRTGIAQESIIIVPGDPPAPAIDYIQSNSVSGYWQEFDTYPYWLPGWFPHVA